MNTKNNEHNKINNTYRAAKHTTSLGYHIGLAIVTAGYSLFFTGLLSGIAHMSRRIESEDSGNRLEAENISQKLSETRNPHRNAIAKGCLQSIWQASSRPVAYAGITTSFIANLSYLLLKSLAAATTRNADENLKAVWNENNKPFALVNTCRDIFWRAGSIAPSRPAAYAIKKSSLLNTKLAYGV